MAAKGVKIERKPIETPEMNYRLTDGLNYSSIKLFEQSPVKFYERVVLKMESDDEDSSAMLLGNIVDDVILTHQGNMEEFEQAFSEKYTLYGGEISGAQGFLLADELFKITKECLDEEGKPTREFQDRFSEAFNIRQAEGNFKNKTVEQGLLEFQKPNKAGNTPESYFETKLASIGKLVVSDGIKARGLQISSNALTDPFTEDYFCFKEKNNKIEKLSKFPITFKYKCSEGEIDGKIEVDELIINHLAKTIQPIDLKTTYDNTQFSYSYLKNRWYIQAVWYSIGIAYWAKQNKMDDYTILPYKFIALDTSRNDRRPLIISLTEDHLNQGYDGFFAYNRYYKGVKELVEAIIWANEHGIWNCDRRAYNNNGELILEEF